MSPFEEYVTELLFAGKGLAKLSMVAPALQSIGSVLRQSGRMAESAAARGAAKPARTFTQGTLKNIRPVAPGSKPVGVPYMPAKSSKGGFNMDSARKALKDRRVQLGLVGAAGAATGYAAG